MAESSKPKSQNRHCAYCLKFLPNGTAKVCAKCHRRAYCSRECQVADWKQKQGSQGHKNWCDLPCGEEDIDWEVVPVEGKGLGVVAIRFIPAKYRIMVEAIRSEDHPGLMDFMPKNGTLEEKVKLNALGCADGPADHVICLRLCRVNHSCDANAGHYYDFTHEVKMLYAERDIQPGEEITISYWSFKNYARGHSPELIRSSLEETWGIICKEDCICRNDRIVNLVKECKNLERQINFRMAACDLNGSLKVIRKILGNLGEIRAGYTMWLHSLFDGFQVGVASSKTMDEGMEYLRRAYEIRKALFHPKFEENEKYEKYIKNPERHPSYLIFG